MPWGVQLVARTFNHLSYEQRLKIKEMLDGGFKKIDIARALGVHNATIYREIERGSVNGIYNPNKSEEQYRDHLSEKGPQALCSMSPDLAEYIAKLILEEHLSPARIIDRLEHEEKWSTFPKSKPTIYSAIDNGLIPGVTRESLNSYMTTMFSDGQIHIAKWVRKQLDLNDGDELLFEIIDNKIVFRKAND